MFHNEADAAALSQFIFGGDSVAGPLVYSAFAA
jgi:hypothetical protein